MCTGLPAGLGLALVLGRAGVVPVGELLLPDPVAGLPEPLTE
jgi:hypothetical protein